MGRFLPIFALVTFSGALIEAPAHAGFFTGNQLYSECTSEKGNREYLGNISTCNGYIMGVLDAADTHAQWDKKIAICIPTGVNTGQLREIVIAELRANPALRHLPAAYFVLSAVSSAFPCKPPPKN